jgi:hypothetical protein
MIAIPSINMPASKSKVFGDTIFDIHRPSNTPTKLVAISAVPAPNKTLSGDFDCAAINIVANCVLSPISAKKIVKKVESQTPAALLPGLLSGELVIASLTPLVIGGKELDTILLSYFSHFLVSHQFQQIGRRK